MNQSATQPESDSDSIKAILSPLESRYLPLIDMLADAIAPKLQRKLDQKVMGKVKGFATNAQPMTSVECVELLTQLGLKPANPAELLAVQDIQALPSSNQ
jgi:negative regulator of sigma E activity